MHHSTQRGGEPPPTQAHHQQAKAAHTEATYHSLAQGCSGRWCLALIEDNLTDHADWRRPGFTLSIAVGRDLEARGHLCRPRSAPAHHKQCVWDLVSPEQLLAFKPALPLAIEAFAGN